MSATCLQGMCGLEWGVVIRGAHGAFSGQVVWLGLRDGPNPVLGCPQRSPVPRLGEIRGVEPDGWTGMGGGLLSATAHLGHLTGTQHMPPRLGAEEQHGGAGRPLTQLPHHLHQHLRRGADSGRASLRIPSCLPSELSPSPGPPPSPPRSPRGTRRQPCPRSGAPVSAAAAAPGFSVQPGGGGGARKDGRASGGKATSPHLHTEPRSGNPAPSKGLRL